MIRAGCGHGRGRRRRAGAGAALAVVVLCLVASACGGARGRATSTTTSASPPSAAPATVSSTALSVPGDGGSVPTTSTTTPEPVYRRHGWVAAENERAGTDAWRITVDEPAGRIEGYLDTTSANLGDAVKLYVASASSAWRVEAYRMGWYHGAGGRLVWQSGSHPAVVQPYATVDRSTGLAEANWTDPVGIALGVDWLPGDYLLKLVSELGGAHYVPLTVRDDATRTPDVLLVNAVATWQAYNPWGACSSYECPFLASRRRANLVSFDRPYAHTYKKGAADFIDHEWPLLSLVEELGLDAAYATSVDLHRRPEIALAPRAVLSLGHDEYYTGAMREALVAARDHGVNLAFFGANAVYRQIRLEPSSDGRPDRVVANWRDFEDPGAKDDSALATVEFRALGRAEHSLVGIGYVCTGVNAPMVVADATSWVFEGAGVSNGQSFRNLVGNEADTDNRSLGSPDNLAVLASSPIVCTDGTRHTATMSYYVAPSGAGVFATGTIWWVCALDGMLCSWPENVPFVRAVTVNVLRAFAAGPAGIAHPAA